jgi:hypothetical protein
MATFVAPRSLVPSCSTTRILVDPLLILICRRHAIPRRLKMMPAVFFHQIMEYVENLDGVFHHQVSISIGKTQALAPGNFARDKGFFFVLK